MLKANLEAGRLLFLVAGQPALGQLLE